MAYNVFSRIAGKGSNTIDTLSQGQPLDVRISYQTLEIGPFDIHLCTLRDKQQFSDPDGIAEAMGISSATWSMFGVVWDSSQVLAHYMLDFDLEGKRILEVGCGVGLTSLMLNCRGMDVTATDHHPEAERMLERNSQLNGGPGIPFVCTGWEDDESSLGQFDLILGSDILYDRRHLEALARFIDDHANPRSEVVIADPGRGECGRIGKILFRLGFTDQTTIRPETPYLKMPFKGRILRFRRN